MMHSRELIDLPGVGPKLSAALMRAGINDPDQLFEVGPIEAWHRLSPFGFDCIRSLQAITAACQGVRGHDLDQVTRAELIEVFNRRPVEIWHLASPQAWKSAAMDGYYRNSTRDQSLNEVGFIHCANPDQVTGVARRFYADLSDELIALVIDLDALSLVADVRFEDSGRGELFPHVHGPLPTNTVVHAWPAQIRHGELYLMC